jgi:hypothetical protein
MNRFALHDVIAFLVRRTWLVTLVTIVVCAGFAARAVASLVEADYLSPEGTAPPLVQPGRPHAQPRHLPDGSTFAERNIFCSDCVRVGPGPTDPSFSGSPALLIATSIGQLPRATVRVLATEVQGSFGLGDAIPGVGKIERIGWRSIDVVDGAGRRATLSLLDASPAGAGAKGAATPQASDQAPASPFAGRIKKIDDHTYEVDRALVRELVSGQSAGGMRAMPLMDKGEITGLRITMARPGSAAAEIGIKPGDAFTSINNEPIKTAQQMLDLLAKLDSLNYVEIQGTRAGKPLALNLRLK